MQIGRADERHLAVARRTIDGDAELHQPVAGRIDIVDLISEMSEVAILAIRFFRAPPTRITRQVQHRREDVMRAAQAHHHGIMCVEDLLR